jgi:DNA processing protein
MMIDNNLTIPVNLSRWIYANEAISWPDDVLVEVVKNPGTINILFEAPIPEIKKFFRAHERIGNSFLQKKNELQNDQSKIKKIIDEMIEGGVTIFRLGDSDYPKNLLKIKDPPIVLYHIGSLFDFSRCIAISGIRDCSPKTEEVARILARELAKEEFVIVSGLAKGVDIAAHRGALDDPKGRTIAVLANGLQKVYPACHLEVARQIVRRGALLTEKVLFPDPRPFDFIRRNRIISGISKIHIFIESSGHGGTKHQYDFAKEQGRQRLVFFGDGLPHKSKEVAKRMIKDGSMPFTNVDEAIALVRKFMPEE